MHAEVADLDDVLTFREIAEEFGISAASVAYYVRRENLAIYRVSKRSLGAWRQACVKGVNVREFQAVYDARSEVGSRPGKMMAALNARIERLEAENKRLRAQIKAEKKGE